MRPNVLLRRWVLPVMLAIGLAAGCSKSDQTGPQAGKAAKEAESQNAGRAVHTVDIPEEMQRILQMKAESLKAASSVPRTTAVGRVLDPMSLVTDVNELVAADAIANASEQELNRTKELAAQNTASVRTVQAAEANAIRDRTLDRTIRDRIALNWGRALARHGDLFAIAHALASQERVLVRIDLPAGERVAGTPRSARVSSAVDGGRDVDVDVIGLAPMTDPQLQSRSYFLLSRANAAQLTPGAAVNAVIEWAGAEQRGAFVPQSAVVRQDQQAWVYIQLSKSRFERQAVSLQNAIPDGWLVTQGLAPGQRVVTQGAQQLLSEETKPAMASD